MTQTQNLILVGFMASGKSRVGRVLSQRLGWPLLDADSEIVKRQGKTIDSIFEEEGEAAFRAVERAVIARLCAGRFTIISAGGGAFVDPENRRIMLQSGTVFCLSAEAETIHSRIGRNSGPGSVVRPLLAGNDPLERIKKLLAQRAGAYAQAHYTIQTDELSPEQVADRILELCSPGTEVQPFSTPEGEG